MLPNGVGMGGQLDYFALFLNKDLLEGHSKGNPSTTFKNPRYVCMQLSSGESNAGGVSKGCHDELGTA